VTAAVLLLAALALPVPAPAAPPAVRCVGLAPHFEGEPSPERLDEMVREIKDLGANQLLVVVQWGQADVHDTVIRPYPWGTRDADIRRVLAQARALGLATLVFPIVRLETLAPGQWRGTLTPRDRAAWWQSYEAFLLHYAQLAAESQATWLSVGSELGSMEADDARWRALIARVRGVFPGRLIYSANWDHFPHVGFWDALDAVGMNAYHPVTDQADPSTEALEAAWRVVRPGLLLWPALLGRPLLFTEVGYPSVRGTAQRPYDFGGDGPADPGAQARAFRAFITTWRDQAVAGACIWLWTGQGGVADRGYMPRGKPAEALLRAWFQGQPLPPELDGK